MWVLSVPVVSNVGAIKPNQPVTIIDGEGKTRQACGQVLGHLGLQRYEEDIAYAGDHHCQLPVR